MVVWCRSGLEARTYQFKTKPNRMEKLSNKHQVATDAYTVLANRLCFRAWIESQNYMAIQGTPDLETLQSFMFHYGDEKNIMQFTGLLDKNGSKIFEGDIVNYKRSVGNWSGKTMTTTHKIIFTEEVNAFVMYYGSSYIKLRKHWGYEYEVIGNIFENPDLLQGVI